MSSSPAHEVVVTELAFVGWVVVFMRSVVVPSWQGVAMLVRTSWLRFSVQRGFPGRTLGGVEMLAWAFKGVSSVHEGGN